MHIKSDIDDGHPSGMYPLEKFRSILALVDKYDMRRHVYFMATTDVMERALLEAPDIARCMSAAPEPWAIVERAIEYKCQKVQLYKPYFNQAMIDKARAHNIRCNVFWSDDMQEAKSFLDMGIDCILTNDYWNIASLLRK